jgi:CRISPR-associated protein Csm1
MNGMSGTKVTSCHEIILGAWLHDIGKFAQRADMEAYCSKELEGQLCKLQQGGWYSHQHVLYTEGFLQAVKDCLPEDDQLQAKEVIRLASGHHNPSSYDEWLIAHGDRLSSGSDRCNIILENKNRDDESPAKFYEKPLTHLVSTLHITEKPKPQQGYSPLEQMEDKAVFASSNAKVSKADYQKLWRQFEQDFRSLRGRKYPEFMQALDTLMERYCWCIPSSTVNDSDISLYQHAKTTAAFAGALYRYHKEKQTETEAALKVNDEEKFLFIQGDMSGIQKYIFDLKTTDNNAKLLRARSFQVWALSEIIAQHLVGQFDVSHENILTSAGGKFLLLVPNTQTIKEKLPEMRLRIERYFIREFAGKLIFVLSEGIPASSRDVQKKYMQTLLNKIGMSGEQAKQKKMQAVIGKDSPIFEELYGSLQKNGECSCCETLPGELDHDNNKKICKNCDELIKIGGNLIKANKIIFKTEKLTHFGEMVYLLRNDDKRFGYLINTYEAGYPLMFLPYVAPWENENAGNLKTFEVIAGSATGNRKLAMFKADIDNLGLVFTSSWGEETKNRISFSRYAQLSRQMHYFFSGYLASFISNHTEYKEKIYTVFSGGDDVCVLGPWDAVMRFALDFRKELATWTNNNPSITLSGGIALASPRLPVRNIAEEAEAALEEAKGRKNNDNTIKDGISVFGVTVGWDEYEKSLEDAKKMLKYLDENKVSSAVIYKMIDFANRASSVKNGNLRDMLWMSNYRYVIARNIKPEHEDTVEFFHRFGVCPDNMIKSRIAVSYALYAKRTSEEE